jgi:hypothetical protein
LLPVDGEPHPPERVFCNPIPATRRKLHPRPVQGPARGSLATWIGEAEQQDIRAVLQQGEALVGSELQGEAGRALGPPIELEKKGPASARASKHTEAVDMIAKLGRGAGASLALNAV